MHVVILAYNINNAHRAQNRKTWHRWLSADWSFCRLALSHRYVTTDNGEGTSIWDWFRLEYVEAISQTICLFQNPTKFYHANAFSGIFLISRSSPAALLVPPNSPYATMVLTSIMNHHYMNTFSNKANLRDLIAVTGLVILLKLDSNRRFFSPCDLEIWWIIGHLFYTTSIFVHHFKSISEFKLELQSGNAQLNRRFFLAVWPWNLTDDLEKQHCTFSILLQALCIIL